MLGAIHAITLKITANHLMVKIQSYQIKDLKTLLKFIMHQNKKFSLFYQHNEIIYLPIILLFKQMIKYYF